MPVEARERGGTVTPNAVSDRHKQLAWILIVFACVLCADQVTKALVIAAIPEPGVAARAQAPCFFRLTHQRNPGLVGGMFRSNRAVAFAAPVFACFVLLYLFRHLDRSSRVQSVAYGLIAGGAIGNLVDRFRLGSVTDFLQFHFYFIPFDFPWKHYPAFNIADSAICVGVFLLIVSWFAVPEEDASNPV